MTDQKIFWAGNLRFLRDRKKFSQTELATVLEISRAKLNAHENGVSRNPPLDDLLKIADYFHLAIDTFLKVDLSKLTELKLRELEAGNDVYVSGGKIRVLSITVSPDNKENAEYVPVKAKAGYLKGFADPEYISLLPKFYLPHLPENRTFRMFPTEGDSMFPIPENCLVITEYVADWKVLRETPCIVMMRTEQNFLFKMVTSKVDINRNLLLHSLNPVYADQEVFVGDVLEVWKYHSHITDVLPGPDTTMQELLRTVQEIKTGVNELKERD